MNRRLLGAASALLVGIAAVAVAQDRKPLSPPGYASTMVGGKWSAPDKDGERRYEGGKWIEVTYSRPMLRGRTDIFGKGADYGKVVQVISALKAAGVIKLGLITEPGAK